MRERIVADFAARYHRAPTVVVRSPGRVNLIGDHTDYNDGFVLPIATEQAMWLAAAPRDDRIVDVTSAELGTAHLDLDHLEPTHGWIDYVAGTLREIAPSLDHGFDALVRSRLPVGAGLSSSAAFELGVARVAVDLAGATWDPVAAAVDAQRAEAEFVGMPSGIMDQLVVASAVAGHAMLIDCRTLEVRPVAIPSGATVVILDTGTRRRLVDSSYRDRRSTCERVAAVLGIPALRDATPAMLATAPLDADQLRRARHVVTENARTVEAVGALAGGDLVALGRLMDLSHASLRDDYEVSSPALDTITEIARGRSGCLGARLTGAGFAGCAVALVETGHVESFVTDVTQAYAATTGTAATLYPTRPVAGVAPV